MTIMGTMLSASMIALGIMLAAFALGAGPPLSRDPPTAVSLSASSRPSAKDIVQLASTRLRSRFVAIDGTTLGWAAPRPTEAGVLPAVARKHVAKKANAPKDKKLLQRPAPVPRPQSAGLQWPWASWFK